MEKPPAPPPPAASSQAQDVRPKRRSSRLFTKRRTSQLNPGSQVESERAGGPRIVALKSQEGYSAVMYCPLVKMEVISEIHLAMAFVRVKGTWRRNPEMDGDTVFIFELPTSHKTSRYVGNCIPR